MGKEIITFSNIETEKRQFHHLTLLEEINIDNIQVPSMVSFREKKNFKYFFGYIGDEDCILKPSHIMLPKKSAYVKSHNGETKSMFFSFGDEQLLKKLGKNSSKNKVTNSMKKKLYCELPAIRNF